MEDTDYVVLDGARVEVGYIAPDSTLVPLVHLRDKIYTACGLSFRVKGTASTEVPSEVTCGACQSAPVGLPPGLYHHRVN